MKSLPGCERNKVQNLRTTLHTVSGVILTFRINYFHLISCRQTFYFVHYSVSRGLLILLSLKALSDPGHGSVGHAAPDGLVTEHVGRELRLGLGDAGSGGSVVAVDLRQYEEVPEGCDDPSGGYDDGDESNEIVPASWAVTPTASGEGGDGYDETASSHLFDAKGHQDRVAELGEEDEKKRHEPHAGVGFEGFVRRAEPAEERERNEEDDVSQGQPEGASIVQTAKEIAESSEEIGEI